MCPYKETAFRSPSTGETACTSRRRTFQSTTAFPSPASTSCCCRLFLAASAAFWWRQTEPPLQEAKCTLEGEMLVIQSDAISRAGRIRICFAETAFHQVNLFNAAGIPALPFERVLVRN